MEATWYALQVRPRCENSCEALLISKGYEVFLPRYIAKTPQSKHERTTRQPLFPGYLFCRLTDNSVGKMVMTPGAVRLLGIGNRPEPVADHEIESLRRLDESGVARQPWRYLPGGSMVEIESGPLAGVRGVLTTDGSARRIIVSVTLLHRSVSAELEENTLLKPLGAKAIREWIIESGATPHSLPASARNLLDTHRHTATQHERAVRTALLGNAS